MSYSIEWHPHALKFLEKLQTQIAERILKKLELIKEEPFRFLKHFEGKFYNLRIGDYRFLIDIDFENKILLIQVLDKRGKVYKR